MMKGYVATGAVLLALSLGLLASVRFFLHPAFGIWTSVAVVLLVASVVLLGIGFTKKMKKVEVALPKKSGRRRIVGIGEKKFHDLLHNKPGEFVVDLNNYGWSYVYFDTREGYEIVLDSHRHTDLLNLIGTAYHDLKWGRVKDQDWKRIGEVGFIFCNWDRVVHQDNQGAVLVEVCKGGTKITIRTDPRTEREEWSIVLDMKHTKELNDLLSEAWSYPRSSVMEDKVFVGYVGDPDIHDGEITQIEREDDRITVVVKGGWIGRYIIIEFEGVESIESKDPVGMMLYSLSEIKAPPPLREFIFTNWYEPDEPEGEAYLRILARDFRVLKEP